MMMMMMLMLLLLLLLPLLLLGCTPSAAQLQINKKAFLGRSAPILNSSSVMTAWTGFSCAAAEHLCQRRSICAWILIAAPKLFMFSSHSFNFSVA